MKLIFCKECHDIVLLITERERYCDCRQSFGRYVDELNATYTGPCVPLGVRNSDLVAVLRKYPASLDVCFFTIPEDCKTFVRRP